MIQELTNKIKKLSLIEQLEFLSNNFKGKIAFSTSFGQEDQVITDIILRNKIAIEIFTLDTGRLFEETYKVWNETITKYGNTIKTYYPNTLEVENLISEKGVYSFYNSIENRKECCNIRKVNPLKRALQNVDLWITGLRAEQSVTRTELAILEQNVNFNTIFFTLMYI